MFIKEKKKSKSSLRIFIKLQQWLFYKKKKNQTGSSFKKKKKFK